MSASATRTLAVCFALVPISCGQVRPEAAPHRFGHSLLAELPASPARSAKRRPARSAKRKPPRQDEPKMLPSWRTSAVRRGRALVGRGFPGPLDEAREALLATVFGKRSSWNLSRLEPRRRKPQPGDLVLFTLQRGKAGKIGVVLSCQGPRVIFLHLRGGKAHLGWLHLGQPNRRRLAGNARVLNSYVRVKLPDDPPETRYLAGQLLKGFAAPPAPPTSAEKRSARGIQRVASRRAGR